MLAEQKQHRIWPFLFMILQIMSWVSATIKPFPHTAQGQAPYSLQSSLKLDHVRFDVRGGGEELAGANTLGSRPPNCQHKCGHCSPCEAIQMPTRRDHLGVQYSNYEPEGWKCKCGSTFYNP